MSLSTSLSSPLLSLLLLLHLLPLLLSPALGVDLSSNALPEDVIAYINGNDAVLWNASLNPTFYNRDLAFVQSLCGVRGLQHPTPPPTSTTDGTNDPSPLSFLSPALPASLPARRYDEVRDEVVPASFDSREQWGSMCPSLRDVRNQGSCGSCWAFGAVEAMTDRTCIASAGAQQPYLAASDPVSCCSDCGSGCDGGTLPEVWQSDPSNPSTLLPSPTSVTTSSHSSLTTPLLSPSVPSLSPPLLRYWIDVGIVTGRGYGDASSCFPYQFPDCSHHLPSPAHFCSDTTATTTPTAQACPTTCPTPTYPTPFQSDKHFGASAYHLPTPRDIQLDILHHGPVEAAFLVYSDFPAYHSGVYHRTEVGGEALGGHAIKVVGWGVEGGVEYWLCVNSWDVEWGNGGTFKIKRGTNECGVEEMVYAGLPALEGGHRK